jgi:hypothetical protein
MRRKLLVPLFLATAIGVAAPACYGSYGAFHSVHKWNGKVTGSKVGNSIIHFALWIIPVYELVLLGDFLIFNNIEFLTDEPVFRP